MTYDSLVNRADYFSAHYLAEVLPKDLRKKDGLIARWTEREKAGEATPRSGLRGLKKPYFKDRAYFADFLENIREGGTIRQDPHEWRKALHELHGDVLRALGFQAEPRTLTVVRAYKEYEVAVAHAEPADRPTVIAIECGWAPDVDAALDPEQAGLLLAPVELDNRERIETGDKLATWLFAGDEPPRYVLILAGGVIVLADRATWGEGRYLAVSLDVALGRTTALPAELEMIAALFGADSLLPPEEGGTEKLAELLAGSRQHAVGVSADLRDGLRDSVEIIANEVLDRIREQGVRPDQIMEPAALARELGRESLRYLYRILFLLYAEARPELGILPTDDEAYVKGYSMARLGDLIVRDLVSEESRRGFHLYESLDLLFRMVNEGHNPRRGAAVESEGEGLRFEPLKADLFDPERTRLIGEGAIVLDDDDPDSPRLDTRLRNETLYRVLRLLMLAKGKRKQRGGFISYAQLGINQLGAVYEGLMSYTGFIANEELYEVAKNGDPKDGSWMIPASKVHDYEDSVFVRRVDDHGFKTDERVRYKPGAFVYRLAGRDRQTSASYYTPESLTQVTVQLALRERLDPDGSTTPAREILDWTICEPALGSGAFLNEAINQVAAEYLKRRQAELGVQLEPDQYTYELQKVKAYIALHNSYGVDLNETAVELAEVSLWLNVMHRGLQAPWFGLHLKRGNSLIGAGRRTYGPDMLKKRAWLTAAPDDRPFRDGPIPDGHVHHFLLPAQGWGAVASEKEAKALAPEESKQLATWRKQLLKDPADKKKRGQKRSQVERLQGLSRRAEFLWDLVIKRLRISEREISRQIAVWEAEDLPEPHENVQRDQILDDLTAAGTPFWRLKTLMDAWCALWFWPLDKVRQLDGSDGIYERLKDEPLERVPPAPGVQEVRDPDPTGFPEMWEAPTLLQDDAPLQMAIAPQKKRSKPVAKPIRVDRRSVIPLHDLDDWLDFAESLFGTSDVPRGSLIDDFDLLSKLSEYEDMLPGWMGMDNEFKLGERYPWLDAVEDIANQQGFFHWELQFAQILSSGGFDVQLGNPPWVRPKWEEDIVLAELSPWFVLSDKPSVLDVRTKKVELLEEHLNRQYVLRELAGSAGRTTFLGAISTYSLLSGTQPDLYRAFMVRAWNNLCNRGAAGLVHPDTHFGGKREARLRAAAYRHLRLHAQFSNKTRLFPEVHDAVIFGIHIYGPMKEIRFQHASWLFEPTTLTASLEGHSSGELPGIKYKGSWDLRPHPSRIILVDKAVLDEWRWLTGRLDTPTEQSSLLYPVTAAERSPIRSLSRARVRLNDMLPYMSSGFHEVVAKKEGLIQRRSIAPDKWSDAIIQGPHIGIATPFYKEAPNLGSNGRPVDLTSLASLAIPKCDFARSSQLAEYLSWQDQWDGRFYTEYYRLAWREMIPLTNERSLFAAVIPPGPAHVNAVHSMSWSSSRAVLAVAGFWASLLLDYYLRISGRGHLQLGDVPNMPAPDMEHPLMDALLVRSTRLNCLTAAYSALWSEVYDWTWTKENWAVSWPHCDPLGEISPSWDADTPIRSELARRAAMVELDALIAVWLGIQADELVQIYRTRFPVLAERESSTWFDVNGFKIAADHNAHGYRQREESFGELMEYLDSPELAAPPEGYLGPFYRANREVEYRHAHAVFSERLERATEAGWLPEARRS